jgi:hypothetical protein
MLRCAGRASGALALVSSAALLVAGCGGSTHSQPQQTSPSATQTASTPSPSQTAPDNAPSHPKRAEPTDPLARIGTVATRHGGPSGVPMPIGNLPGWKQVFRDDFPASEDAPIGRFAGCSSELGTCSALPAATAAKWSAYPDGVPDTWGNGRYMPSQVLSIHGGLLDFHLHTDAATGVREVAAAVPRIHTSTGLSGMLHGAYAVRFKASTLSGYEAAWQLYPDSGDGLEDGEIGFPAGPLSGPVQAWLHWPDATSEDMNYSFQTRTRFSGWHTAVLEWNPKFVRYILDGKVMDTVSRHLPTVPMNWVLQTEVEEAPNLPSVRVAGHIYVAWATAYSWDPR